MRTLKISWFLDKPSLTMNVRCDFLNTSAGAGEYYRVLYLDPALTPIQDHLHKRSSNIHNNIAR